MKIINQTTETTPTDAIRPHPRNPRQGDIGAIHQSIQNNGFYGTIIAQRSTGYILAGNHRWQAARQAKAQTIPVTWVEVDDDHALRILLADNRTNDLATYDDNELANLLQQLHEQTGTLQGTGYDTDDLDDLLSDLNDNKPKDGLTNPDDVPESPAEPTTKLGDLWILGDHRLLCGDSTNPQHVERLMDGEKADMVFTDPPYALFGNSTGATVADDKMIRPFFRDIGKAIFLSAKKGAHFYSCLDWKSWAAVIDSYSNAGLTIKNMIVWDKGHGALGQAYRSQHELIMFGVCANVGITITKTAAVSSDRQINDVNVWQCSREPKQGMHAALKPQDLIKRALNNSSSKGELVLDLFGGSGSTLIACENTSRKCRMMEMEPKYCDVIVKRWEDYTGNKAELHT